jgi:hypothetical protein
MHSIIQEGWILSTISTPHKQRKTRLNRMYGPIEIFKSYEDGWCVLSARFRLWRLPTTFTPPQISTLIIIQKLHLHILLRHIISSSCYSIFSTSQVAVASISYSLNRCRMYVLGQSMQTQLASGSLSDSSPSGREKSPIFLEPSPPSSLRIAAKLPECSKQWLQLAHSWAASCASCCDLFNISNADCAAFIPSLRQSEHTTTLSLPLDMHRRWQREQTSLPKYEEIIALLFDLTGQK